MIIAKDQNIHHTFHSEINYDIMLKCLTGYGCHQRLRYTSLNENVHMEWTDFGALLILKWNWFKIVFHNQYSG